VLDPSEEKQLEELITAIHDGCCVGEFSITGEIHADEQMLWSRLGASSQAVRTALLDQLVSDHLVSFSEEAHSFNLGERRRVYYVRSTLKERTRPEK